MSGPAPPSGRLKGRTADPGATRASGTAATTRLPARCAHPDLAPLPVAQAGQVSGVDPEGERGVQAGQGRRPLYEHPSVPHRAAGHQAQGVPIVSLVSVPATTGGLRWRGSGGRRDGAGRAQAQPGRPRQVSAGGRFSRRPRPGAGRAPSAWVPRPGDGHVGTPGPRVDDRGQHGRRRV